MKLLKFDTSKVNNTLKGKLKRDIVKYSTEDISELLLIVNDYYNLCESDEYLEASHAKLLECIWWLEEYNGIEG